MAENSSVPNVVGATPGQSTTDADRFFNLSSDLLCVMGLDGYFKRLNPSWPRVLGWSENELLARPVSEFIHPDDRERTLQASEGRAHSVPPRGWENRYLCKDGSFRWLAWQSVTGTDSGAALVFAIARDITERRQLDGERLAMSKMESTGILAGGLAHDFNNLLASLLLNVEMTGLSGPLNSQQTRFLTQARQSIQAAKALTQQLLAFSGGDASVRRTMDLRGLLQQSLDLALQGSTLQSECEIAPDLWPGCVNETLLAQVFRGLILNAREATPNGGKIRLRAENVVLAAQNPQQLHAGEYLRISVADEGAGIPADVLPHIFEPYFSTRNRGVQKGRGLGLAICRAVIRRHGGIIAIESEVGRGTTVTCHLPAAQSFKPTSKVPFG
jgi:PAS domain S-box-containing protein